MRQVIKFRSGRLVKYVTKKNIFTPPGSKAKLIGFNYNALKIIQEKSKQKNIYIQYGKNYQKVNIKKILEDGKFLHFLKEGFELQVFYPMEMNRA